MTISLKNTTDIPDQKIREITEFTRPDGVSNNFNVRVTSSNKNILAANFISNTI